MSKNLSKEVLQVLDQSSEIIGRYKADDFSVNNWNNIQDNPIDSPIEQILYIAFNTIREISGDSPSEPAMFNGKVDSVIIGLGMWEQRKIGKYKVDFMAGYGRILGSNQDRYEYEEVVIECDSQEFHERTEKERRYEKKRDRFLQKQGYKIFHYTGKEIMEHPYNVASDIIGHLTHTDPEELLLMFNEWI